MVLAARGMPGWPVFVWTTLAMAGARTGAMAANRLIDAEIDARNPRTASRRSRCGYVKTGDAGPGAGGVRAAARGGVATEQPGAGAGAGGDGGRDVLLLYQAVYVEQSLDPRPGGRDCAGGRWNAVTGEFSTEAALLALVVTFWIGGFDVLYATQECSLTGRKGCIQFRHALGWRGVVGGASFARVDDWCAAGAGIRSSAGWPYWVGVAVIAALLVYENRLLKPDDLSRLSLAFFNINGYVAVAALVFTILGVWLG